MGWRRLRHGLKLFLLVSETVLWMIYLVSVFAFRFYMPLKIRRWWAVRGFRKRLMAEGVPEDLASKIAEMQIPDVLGFLSFRRLISLGRREKR